MNRPDALVGQWFLSFDDDNDLARRGRVLQRLEPEIAAYVVEYVYWTKVEGKLPTHREVVHASEMMGCAHEQGWQFFTTQKQWESTTRSYQRKYKERRREEIVQDPEAFGEKMNAMGFKGETLKDLPGEPGK